MLPDFAIKEQEECQLLAYHLARGNWDRHQNYQSLLAEVEQRLGNLMVSSTLRIEESQVQIEELKGKMRETYETVKNRRGVITRLKALVNEHYLRIVRAIRK